ncbi:glycosyltransferase [Faecalicatena sp. AGMB00832]|uniref:Glycosyltransferase n=1 Tax=Faecalicatena faecalis TaxID=2726362 RepID=A0ABS6D792_9FIRM|nr:glycosyltransferase [Faecalicatena faecalis]MBU3877047.1 glycosyltransferase [Faecalicatena faecalis]
MKRILAGFIMDGKAGGVDKYLLNFLDAVKNQDVQIDFLTDEVHEELKTYLAQYHCNLYPIASLRHPVRQFRQVCAVLQQKHYDMIYLNVSTAIDCIAAFAAKKMRVKERAIHSHSSGNDCESTAQRLVYDVVHRICKMFFYRAGTRFYGCSVKAGEWIFPKKIVQSEKFEVIYNAVDRNRFQYKEEIRRQVRKELGITDEQLVIGHIGNFCYAKNYPFLIDLFSDIHEKEKDSVFLLTGTGVELEEVREMVKKRGLTDCIRFLGWRKDADRLYQAMDLFVLPSRFEGLPIVGVEAQCAKLACVLSDTITREAKIQDHCHFLPLADGTEKWAGFILQHSRYDRMKVALTAEAANYDLDRQKEQLRRIVCH